MDRKINVHEMDEEDILDYVYNNKVSYDEIRSILTAILLRSALRGDLIKAKTLDPSILISSCDHCWGDPEYKTTRILYENYDTDVGDFRMEICDKCKTITYYINNEKAFAWRSINSQ